MPRCLSHFILINNVVLSPPGLSPETRISWPFMCIYDSLVAVLRRPKWLTRCVLHLGNEYLLLALLHRVC